MAHDDSYAETYSNKEHFLLIIDLHALTIFMTVVSVCLVTQVFCGKRNCIVKKECMGMHVY